MTPNSYSYLVFLTIAALVFWTLPRSWRMAWVLIASASAYVLSDGLYVWIAFAMAAVTWGCHRLMHAGEHRKGLWRGAGVASILALLAAFKYRDFAAANVNALLASFGGRAWHVPPLEQLPLGISFCAFNAIAFLIDSSQGRVRPQPFSHMAALLSFWPTAMAGPLWRFREFGPQWKWERCWETRMLIRGMDRIVWGLVQKNLIANNLEAWVREGFTPQVSAMNTTIDNWFLAMAFGLQIYFDFASYSNLAIGAAQLIGITAPENFRFPYHAANPAEFWSRWHMTLSRWIRDYLFFPLSVRWREAGFGYYVSLVAVMAMVGLWHGAGWGFVVWGAMHGGYLAVYRAWQQFASRHPSAFVQGRSAAVIWRVMTLAAVAAAWVPFRAATLGQAGRMLRSMFLTFQGGLSYPINFYLTALLIAAFCLLEPLLCAKLARLDQKWSHGAWMVKPPISESGSRVPAALADREGAIPPSVSELLKPMTNLNPMLARPALYAVGLFLFLILDDRSTGFIYFQF